MSERSPSNIRAITVTVLTIAMAVVSYWFVFTPNLKESTTYSYRGVEVQLQEPLIALNNIGYKTKTNNYPYFIAAVIFTAAAGVAVYQVLRKSI